MWKKEKTATQKFLKRKSKEALRADLYSQRNVLVILSSILHNPVPTVDAAEFPEIQPLVFLLLGQ